MSRHLTITTRNPDGRVIDDCRVDLYPDEHNPSLWVGYLDAIPAIKNGDTLEIWYDDGDDPII